MMEEAAKNLMAETARGSGTVEAADPDSEKCCSVFTVNGNICRSDSASVRLLNDVDYMKIGINRDMQRLLLIPCDEYDVKGFKWVREKEGKRVASVRTGLPFVLMLCKVMNWNPRYRHRIPGRVVHKGGREYLSYDLSRAVHFPKGVVGRSAEALDQREGPFCPSYAEGNKSIEVQQYGQYTIWMLVEEKTTDGGDESEDIENGSKI